MCPASSIALNSSSVNITYQQHAKFVVVFFLLSEFIGYYAGRGHSQDNESDLTVSLAGVRHVEVRQHGLRSQGFKLFSGDPPVLADCVVNTPKCLDGVPLTAEVLTYPVETLSPVLKSFYL